MTKRALLTPAALAALTVAVTTMTASPGRCADETPVLDVGARVRVQTTGTQPRHEGRVVAWDPEQLTLETKTGRDPVVIPYRQVTGLYVSGGRGRGKAATIGALVGVAAVGALFLTVPTECSGSGCAELFALVALPTAATGALIGAAVAPERWREVTAPGRNAPSLRVSERVRVGFAPAPGGGVRFAASYSY